ncbi:DUF2125 domain-containing protein [Shumkonia mesophila]|uniref:DUF2125 domain-containing protein n=1 Tax=Shumkonia mesophila TaxID=2838854 RepID=UPI002934D895|nr:DUF2125 domain-containing protein [Shumkonia mesophila]
MRQPTPPRPGKDADRHPALGYREPRRLRAVTWALGAVVAAIVAGALYVGGWYYAAGLARDSLLNWAEAQRREGAVVAFERLDIGGFPFHLRLALDKPAYSAPTADAPWGWEAGQVVAEMRPWNLRQFTLRAPGRHALMWTADGARRKAEGLVHGLSARVRLEGGQPVAGHVEVEGADFAGDGPLDRLTLGSGTLDLVLSPVALATARTPVADIRLAAHDLGVPSVWGLPLGADVAVLELAAAVLGGVPPGPLVDALAGWRDDGGTVEVRRLGLDYGPLTLAADGTLALDADLQPIGAFTTRIEGFFETVDALRDKGIIRAQDAVTAKMVLGILSKRNDAGRVSLTVPLTVQDRRLYVGPVPLAAIPSVRWQGR